VAPSDFHLFGPLDTTLVEIVFADDEEVEMVVQKWLRQESKDFCAVGSSAL
jgi:CRISPR/Cas system endoribonuclease Cas6 (RAMP superfamily)